MSDFKTILESYPDLTEDILTKMKGGMTPEQEAKINRVMPPVVQHSLAAWFSINKKTPDLPTILVLTMMLDAWKAFDEKKQGIILAMGWGWLYDRCIEFLEKKAND